MVVVRPANNRRRSSAGVKPAISMDAQRIPGLADRVRFGVFGFMDPLAATVAARQIPKACREIEWASFGGRA